MRNILLSCAILGATALFGGCGDVRTASKLADRTDPAIADRLTGIWEIVELENATPIHVAAGSDGMLHVAALHWADGKWKLEESVAVAVKTPGGRELLSVKQPDARDAPPWALAMVNTAGPERVIKLADANREWFKRAVEQGPLKGRIEKDKDGQIQIGGLIEVTSPSDQLMAEIDKAFDAFDAGGFPMQMTQGLTLRRISREP